MTYRDDAAALYAYHDSLVTELGALDAQLGGLGATLAARERIASELSRVRGEMEERQQRQQPLRLAKLKVASPCHESWDDMVGDHQARHCGRCDKQVFNLSEMTADDAEALLRRSGVTPCVRFYRRADGTVKTKDCPDRRPWFAGAVAASAMAAAGLAAALGGSPSAALPPVPYTAPVAPPAPPPVWTAGAPVPEPPMPVMGGIAPPSPPVEIEIKGEAMMEMGDVAAPATIEVTMGRMQIRP